MKKMSDDESRIWMLDEKKIKSIYEKEKTQYGMDSRDLDLIRKRALMRIPFEKYKVVKIIIKRVDYVLFHTSTSEGTSDLSDMENFNRAIYCAARTVIELWKELTGYQPLIQVLPTTRFPQDRPEQTELFRNCTKNFARLLLLQPVKIDNVPRIGELEDFWGGLWGKVEDEHVSEARARLAEVERNRIEMLGVLPEANSKNCLITIEELQKVLRDKKQWSPPGIDGVQTFWYKHFKKTHRSLLRLINTAIEDPGKVPKFLTEGITMLSPKGPESTIDKSKYRPITFLPEMYKIITKCLYVKIHKHLIKHKILAHEQMAGRMDCFGLKMPLILHSIAASQNEYRAYIDYKKAYDMLPHSWLIEILVIYKVDSAIKLFLESVMKNWCTTLFLRRDAGDVLVSKKIPMKRGIFQGDSLSVLWYCMAVNPLSFQLRNSGSSTNHLSHLLYVDDLVIFSKNRRDLESICRDVLRFTESIDMEISFEKSYYLSVKRAHDNNTKAISLGGEKVIEYTSEKEYKYLGYIHKPVLSHEEMIGSKISSFKRNVEKVMNTKLEFNDKINAINALVLPKIFQTFGILAWDEFLDISQLDMWLEGLLKNDPDYVNNEQARTRIVNIREKLENECGRLKRHFRSAANKADNDWLKETIKNDNKVTPLNLHNLLEIV